MDNDHKTLSQRTMLRALKEVYPLRLKRDYLHDRLIYEGLRHSPQETEALLVELIALNFISGEPEPLNAKVVLYRIAPDGQSYLIKEGY